MNQVFLRFGQEMMLPITLWSILRTLSKDPLNHSNVLQVKQNVRVQKGVDILLKYLLVDEVWKQRVCQTLGGPLLGDRGRGI